SLLIGVFIWRLVTSSATGEKFAEPGGSVIGDLLERAGLLEKMGRVWDDTQLFRAAKFCECLFVQANDDIVSPADQEEGGTGDQGERGPREVRPAATRYHGASVAPKLCRGQERGRSASARSEKALQQMTRLRICPHEFGGVRQAPRQEWNVKT